MPSSPASAPSSKSAETESAEYTTTKPTKSSHDGIAGNSSAKTNPSDQKQSTTTTTKTVLLLVSAFLSMFLVGLDRTIISTAIPQIADEFNSLTDIGWYGSAYLLTSCAFQLLFGKIYTLYSVRAVFLSSILLFEAASALCGAAPNSVAFIVGRAVSGIGSAGIFAGTIICVIHSVPLHKRPQIQGLFGALFGLAAIIGPLMGGAFTSRVTWRWCFYINLPLGALAMIVIALCFQVPDRDTTKLSSTEKLLQLDGLGTAVLVPGMVCLVLALQWGGQMYMWNDGRIIALLTLTAGLLLSFVAVQILLPKTATLPPRIFKQRSIVAGFWQTVCVGSGNYIFVYFLPIWFQAIKGTSAVESGVRLLPLMLSMVVGSIGGGIVNQKIGYYTPVAIVGSCLMSVGAGLLTTFSVDSDPGSWIGYQVLYGIGLGFCFQVPNLAAQTVLPKMDVPIGLALMLFGQLLGAAIFVAVGENVLGNQLVQKLSGIPGFDASLVTSGGATSLISSFPPDMQEVARIAYNEALRTVFRVGLTVSCLAVLGAAAMEWKSILHKSDTKQGSDLNEALDEAKITDIKE